MTRTKAAQAAAAAKAAQPRPQLAPTILADHDMIHKICRAVRISAGLGGRELARTVGIGETTVANREGGLRNFRGLDLFIRSMTACGYAIVIMKQDDADRFCAPRRVPS